MTLGLPGYDAWKCTPPDEFTSDDINGDVILKVLRLRVDDDGELAETEVRVDVRVRRGEVQEAHEDDVDGLPVELTPDEEERAVELAAMDPDVMEDE